MNQRKHLVVFWALIVLLTTGTLIVLAGDSTTIEEIDMTIASNTVTYNDAIFQQGLIMNAKSKHQDPFLAIWGWKGITKGYNTEPATNCEFNTVGCYFGATHALLVSSIPEVEIADVSYREFILDINERKRKKSYLALNELKLWLSDEGEITGYDPDTSTWPGADGVLGNEDDPEMTSIWDLDGGVVLMDYSLASGYGEVDITFLVPSSLFDTTGEDCSYGSESCTTYLVMSNEFGNYPDSALYPQYNWGNDGGFEEWGVVIRPIVNISKDAMVTVDRTVDWQISLTADPNTHDLAVCHSGTSWYDLKVTKNEVIDIVASGTITIQNPTGGDGYPIPAEIDAVITDVQDVITQGDVETDAFVDCGVTFPYTIYAGDNLVCSYTTGLATTNAGSNTATATYEILEDAETSEPVTSTVSGMVELIIPPETLTGFDEINLENSEDVSWGPIADTAEWTYHWNFTCPGNPEYYTNGTYTYISNRSTTIIETDDISIAPVTVNCTYGNTEVYMYYLPMLGKNAEGD